MPRPSVTDRWEPAPPRDVEELLDVVITELHARGERMTTPRKAVLTVLSGRQCHLSAEEIMSEVAVRFPSVHRASVYRSLEALCTLGVLQHVHVGHGATAYHIVQGDGPHLHVQCRVCGTVRDLPNDLLDDVAQVVTQRFDFVLDPSHVALSGLCAECRPAQG
jgi:Fur family ferric uptake transcriptional regulator